jgi:hypothetical protein
MTYSQHGGFGVSSGGGPSAYTEERYTTLAALLSPPAEPTYQSPWGLFSVVWVGFWTLGLLTLPGIAAKPDTASWVIPADIAILSLFIGGVVWWKFRTSDTRRRELDELHPRWERLMDRWDRSYYCHRDGVVFVPGDNDAIPAAQFPDVMAGSLTLAQEHLTETMVQPRETASEVAPSAVSGTTGWFPEYRVPRGGMLTWAHPDYAEPAITTLAGHLELVVERETEGWALVRAENGWSGWVESNRLVPLRK